MRGMLKNGELHKFSFCGIPFLTPSESRLLFTATVPRASRSILLFAETHFGGAVNCNETRGEEMTEQYAIECRQITKGIRKRGRQ